MFESDLVVGVGKTYKVCLKPFEELLALGLVEGWEEEHTWYREYLGSLGGSEAEFYLSHLDYCIIHASYRHLFSTY